VLQAECRDHQETITDFVFAHHEWLNDRPSAFIFLSLSAVLEEAKTEAQKYVDRFVSATGWQVPVTS
jgi:menaquinone-dependent protoporphyrinogen oxidase